MPRTRRDALAAQRLVHDPVSGRKPPHFPHHVKRNASSLYPVPAGPRVLHKCKEVSKKFAKTPDPQTRQDALAAQRMVLDLFALAAQRNSICFWDKS